MHWMFKRAQLDAALLGGARRHRAALARIAASRLGLSTRVFLRYVAIGDSTTEGLEDPDPRGAGFRGFADRLAERLAALDPAVRYANLAIRGRKAAHIHAEQFVPALAMAPDLASVVGGVNDILRPKVDLAAVAGHVEAMVAALRSGGATVLMMTYPDPAKVDAGGSQREPARAGRLQRDELRAIAARHNTPRLMDLGRHGVVRGARSPDRLHANQRGPRADRQRGRRARPAARRAPGSPAAAPPGRARRSRPRSRVRRCGPAATSRPVGGAPRARALRRGTG